MNAIKDVFKARLNARMDELKKSSIMLSREIDIQPPTIQKYRSGSALPSLDALVRIARALDCSTDFLLGLVDRDGNREHLIESSTVIERELLNFVQDRSVEEQRRMLDILRLINRPPGS